MARYTSARILFIALSLPVGAMVLWHYWSVFAARDEYQMAAFRTHKPAYEALLQMLQQDKYLKFINSDLTTPDDPSDVGISVQRLAEYRRRMAEIGVGAIWYDGGYHSAVFVPDTWRQYPTDVLYFPLDRKPLQSHLIEDHWYLGREDF